MIGMDYHRRLLRRRAIALVRFTSVAIVRIVLVSAIAFGVLIALWLMN
ncbi:MAG: hypothetical protein N2559_17490 [Anaerolineae bacterium]|nr:hypothetical protein [Anaerolineae bacterium]